MCNFHFLVCVVLAIFIFFCYFTTYCTHFRLIEHILRAFLSISHTFHPLCVHIFRFHPQTSPNWCVTGIMTQESWHQMNGLAPDVGFSFPKSVVSLLVGVLIHSQAHIDVGFSVHFLFLCAFCLLCVQFLYDFTHFAHNSRIHTFHVFTAGLWALNLVLSGLISFCLWK